MGFWFALFLFVASTVVSAMLQKKPQDAKAAGKGDFQFPTAEAGRPIPVIFGTCLLKGPNVTWWGDLKVQAIKKKSGGFLGIGAKKVTVGYKYYVGLMLAFCHGTVDAILKVYVGEKDTGAGFGVVGSPEQYQTITIDREDLFGGKEQEGGIKGSGRFYRGLSSQTSDPYLTAQWGSTAPAYRGLCYLVMNQVYVGTSQYVKNWAVEARRCPTPSGMFSGWANINGDANPAHALVDIMSNPSWGLGISLARFDLTSFNNAASTLYSEGFGMSFILDSSNSADSVISDILRTIDGTVYTDPATGLWTLKLARADYDPATLPSFTVDSADVPEWSRGSWSETLNEVKVSFTDRAKFYQTNMVQAQESANYATQGMKASQSMEFNGVSNKTLATKIAARELKTHSYPLAQFRLKLNRSAWALRPGSVFKFSFNPQSGTIFENIVLRATNIRYGALEDGKIEVEAVEDIFAIGSTAFVDPDDPLWEDPITDPVACSAVALFEAPYWLVGEERWAMVAAARGDSSSYLGEVWLDETGASNWFLGNELTSFTPSGVLAVDYSAKTAALDSVGFKVDATGTDLSRLLDEGTDLAGAKRGDNVAIFATGEIVAWQTATDNGDGTYSIAGVLRGVMDTVPVSHATGERVWFISEGAATTKESSYPADLTVRARVLPRNARGTVAIGAASTVTLATSSRAWKPYPPGNVKINTLGYGSWPTTTVGDVALTWDHRNRVTQGSGLDLIAQDTAGSYAIEGSYTVEILVGGAVKRTFTGLSGLSQTYSGAQRVADDVDGTKEVTMRITPINGAYTGTVRTTPPVIMTGFGMTFGQYFGGIQG